MSTTNKFPKEGDIMKQLKLGGLSAILLTVIYTIGIVMQGTILNTGHLETVAERFAFAGQHANLMILWVSLLYIIFGVILIVLTVAIHDMITIHNGFMSRLIMGFGLVWSTLVIASGMIYNNGLLTALKFDSVAIYEMTQTIHSSIGGNNEIIGGIWTLLIVMAGFKYQLFPKWVGVIGLGAGVGGVLTMVPSLYESTIMVFALGQMVWWIGIGIHLLRKKVIYG